MAETQEEGGDGIEVVEPAPQRAIPKFLEVVEPPRFLVLINKDMPACRLIQSPISMQQLLAEASKLGTLSQVMVMVPQNPEGI